MWNVPPRRLVTVPEGIILVAALDKTDRLHLLKEHEMKNPPRCDDLAAQNVLSELPTGRRVLVVLICAMVALGTILLLLAHFQH
jgi:hypothetical protein